MGSTVGWSKRAVVGRLAVAASALVVGAGLAGCMHVSETSDVGSNGSSTNTWTITLSPKLQSLFGVSVPQEIAELRTEMKKEPLPGQVSVSTYTDKTGWKGVEVLLKLPTPKALEEVETSHARGSDPQFSTFSMTNHGTVWTINGKFNAVGIDKGISKLVPTTQAGTGANLVKTLEKLGFSYVISFKLPGRVISDNATSKAANGTLSWNMMTGPSTLEASWDA